jgi:xanthine dehydrogenase small subunit
MEHKTNFILNNEDIHTDLAPGTVLLDFIRGQQRLRGTKIGCREGDCGACTVLVGSLAEQGLTYRTVTSCLMPLGNAAHKHVVTIEGLNNASLTPVQQALVDAHASQCGFCTPGFVVSLTGFCLSSAPLSMDRALEAVSGNICRCTGYKSIERAIAEIVARLADLPAQDRLTALTARGFLPDYFGSIPERLKALPQKAPEAGGPESEAGLLLGGGTDLYVQKAAEMVEKQIEFLADREALREIRLEDGYARIGGSVTLENLRCSEVLHPFFPRLQQDLKRIASQQIRNMATVAGNLVNASPIGDMAVMLLALNSEVILNDRGARRRLSLQNFYQGYKKLDLRPGEILEAVRFRAPAPSDRFNFEKISKRTHLDIASVNSALVLEMAGNRIAKAGVAAGGVAPVPLYLKTTADYLSGRPIDGDTVRGAAEMALKEIAPISDIRGTAAYRRLLVRQLIYAHFCTLFPGHSDWEGLL